MGDEFDSGPRHHGMAVTTVSEQGTGARTDATWSGLEDGIERHGLRFQTQRRIARGGMASILHAYDPVLGRHVAIKSLHPALAQQLGELESFLREARLSAQLDHPNIVPVYDLASGPLGGWACFAMKLVQGESLAERLTRLDAERLSPTELPLLLDVLLKICDAVSYAHSRRVLHLDLKPNNVMIGSHGQVYVMDWGIAVRCEKSEQGWLKPVEVHASLRGTLAYMAPEQCDRSLSQVDERADVYGIGAILYELLCGRPPFTVQGDERDTQRLREHQVREPMGQGVPFGLARVAMRALAKEPEQRYASVDELRQELEQLLHGGRWLRERHFEANDVILAEGGRSYEAFVIISGECDVSRDGLVLKRISAGDVFGEVELFTGEISPTTVRAVGSVTALAVTRDTFDRELAGLGWLGTLVRAMTAHYSSEQAR